LADFCYLLVIQLPIKKILILCKGIVCHLQIGEEITCRTIQIVVIFIYFGHSDGGFLKDKPNNAI